MGEDTFGSIQFAFRVFDTTHSHAVSVPVFKRVLSQFGFLDDARILFQSSEADAGDRHVGESTRCPVVIGVMDCLLVAMLGGRNSRDARVRLEDMKHLSSWQTHSEAWCEDDCEDAQATEVQASERKPKGKREAASQVKIPEEPSIPAASSRTHCSSRSYTSMSDFFHYCRVPRELDIMTDVSAKHRSKHRQAMCKTFSANEVLKRDDTSAAGQFKLPPSPYGRPVVGNTWVGDRGGGNSKLGSSVSLPSLLSKMGCHMKEKLEAPACREPAAVVCHVIYEEPAAVAHARVELAKLPSLQ